MVPLVNDVIMSVNIDMVEIFSPSSSSVELDTRIFFHAFIFLQTTVLELFFVLIILLGLLAFNLFLVHLAL